MALTPAEIAAMERMETSRCPRSSIKSHDPAIEPGTKETLQRVRDHYKVPGQKSGARAPGRSSAKTPLDVDYGFLINGEQAAGRELRCGRCFQVIASTELLASARALSPTRRPRPTRRSAHGLTECRSARSPRQEPEHVRRQRAVGAAEALRRFSDREEDRGSEK